MSLAVPAINTFLKRGDAADPEVFTTVAEVKSITGPDMSVNIVDITTHSTGTPWREKLATLLDAGSISFDLNYAPGNAAHSMAAGIGLDFVSRTLRNWQLAFPDAEETVWGFAGYVSKFSASEPVDGVINAALSITLTGMPDFAVVVTPPGP